MLGILTHEPTKEYAYPLSRNRLLLKLRCVNGAHSHFFVRFCNRFHGTEFQTLQMECRSRDGEYSWLYAEIGQDSAVRYIKYYFETEDGICLGADGPGRSMPGRCFEYMYANESDVFHVPEWAQGAVFYQIFPERYYNADKSNDPAETQSWGGAPTRENFFGGDIRGIIEKLDHIARLGADALYLTPIFLSPSNHKYDTQDYYRIDPAFGTLDDLRELVARCHERSMRVILDGVFDHCGFAFPPFQDVLARGEESAYAGWFYIDAFPVTADPPNYECVGYYKWMPKLRLSNPDARAYFIGVGKWWIREANIDGWRIDVADEVDYTFLQEFRRAVKAEKADALLIGETWKDGRDMLRGDQMDSVMNYLFRDAALGFFAERTLGAEAFDGRLQRMLSLYPAAVYPVLYNLLGSHDTPRLATLCGGDAERARLAVAFQMTFPGMPAVYYGDELFMAGENDPGCRSTMAWENGDSSMLEFYKRLVSLRKSSAALMRGDFRAVVCDGTVYGYSRRHGGETVYVLINNGSETKTVTVPLWENGPLASILDSKIYKSEPVSKQSGFYNGDIHRYRAQFEMALPARRFELIKQGGNEG